MPRARAPFPDPARRGLAAHGLVLAGLLFSFASCAEERPAATDSAEGRAGDAQRESARVQAGRSDADRGGFEDALRAIESYIAAGRTREAELIARRLISSDAADPSLRRRADEYGARAFFARAELSRTEIGPAARAELLREAAGCAARAATPPAGVDAYRFAAMLADRIGDRADAQRLYDEALRIAPDDTTTLLAAALAALAADPSSAAARALAARHAAVAPDAPWTRALAAEIALADGNAAKAVQFAEEALALDRDLLELRVILAKSLRSAGRPADAARMLGALAPDERAKGAIAIQLAQALAASGDHARAASAWLDAVRNEPTDAFLRAECALALRRAGNEAAAAAELAALDALPDGPAQRARIDPILREIAQRNERPPSR